MNQDDLPPLLKTQRRYGTSIPEGRMSFHSPSQIPIVSKRGSVKNVPLSMRDIMSDPSMIDKKLRLLSQNGNKSQLNFLKYKFNPSAGDDELDDKIVQGIDDKYGQLKVPGKQKISINVFYEHKNVLFQDERAPLVYNKLFMERSQ